MIGIFKAIHVDACRGGEHFPVIVVIITVESVEQSLSRKGWRKVRASKGRVPGNAWEARAYGKCHRKRTASGTFGNRR